MRASGREGTENFQLISDEELEEIRRIWVKDKNEIEDRVPEIYKEATGRDYPFDNVDEGALFNRDDIALLKSIASKENSADDLHYQLVRNLLNIERNYSTATRRVGIYENLEKALINGGFANKDEAYQFALKKSQTTTDDEEQVKNMMESSAIYETSDLFPIDESEGKA